MTLKHERSYRKDTHVSRQLRHWIVLEMIIATQLANSMEPEDSVPCSQKFIRLYTDPAELITNPYTYFSKITFILSSHLCLCLPSVLFLWGFPTKIVFAFYSSPCVLHAFALFFVFVNNVRWKIVQIMKFSGICYFIFLLMFRHTVDLYIKVHKGSYLYTYKRRAISIRTAVLMESDCRASDCIDDLILTSLW
jgi:hypothetical protein